VNDFPRRGQVWLVNWSPGRGSEQAGRPACHPHAQHAAKMPAPAAMAGRRPALVIQNDIGNEKASTTIVAAISSSVKIFPMNVKIDPPEGGLEFPSIVKTSQILTVDKKRLERMLGQLSSEKMEEVNLAVKLSLDLT